MWSAPSDFSRSVQSRFQSLFVARPQLETSGRTDADAKTTTILAPRWYFGEAQAVQIHRETSPRPQGMAQLLPAAAE